MANEFRIIEICKERGLSQKDLAEQMGISRVGLSKAINGNTTITTLKKIAETLNVPLYDLFNKEEGNASSLTCPKCGAELELRVKE